MSQKMISLRISTTLLERVEGLAATLQNNPRFSPRGKLTRTDLLREAILRGLDSIDEQIAAKKEDAPAAPSEGGILSGLNPGGAPPRPALPSPAVIRDEKDDDFEQF